MKIQPKNKEDKWPQVRLGDHAACCLGFNTENPQLLVSGGRLRRELPLKDIWILNLATMKWKEVLLTTHACIHVCTYLLTILIMPKLKPL